jgi:ubiquinone/menaquinone biosynthesis C-methylase UbiE
VFQNTSGAPLRPDFAALAERYDELRPADAKWEELAELIVREGDLRGRRVLEVGCGTGRLASRLAERYGARVWGIDPTAEMLAQARRRAPRGVGFKLARAEALPFADGWFERAVMWLVVHLVDRPRAFAEVRRVLRPDGRLTIATFDPTHFDGYWLNALFPSLEAIDRARFPTEDELAAELDGSGLRPRLLHVSRRASLSRADALERIRGRYISTLRMLAEEEYVAGLERAERELPERIEYALEWLVAIGERA